MTDFDGYPLKNHRVSGRGLARRRSVVQLEVFALLPVPACVSNFTDDLRKGTRAASGEGFCSSAMLAR